MTTVFHQPDAPDRIKAAKLQAGSWGGTEAVCMMSALVTGAECVDDCVTAGWPRWLADLNVLLFDCRVGAESQDADRCQFAMDLAIAVQSPFDADKARDLFLIATLEQSKFCDIANVTQPVIDLLHRRIAGEDVAKELDIARRAADAAALDCASAFACIAAEAAYSAAVCDAVEAVCTAASAARSVADPPTHHSPLPALT